MSMPKWMAKYPCPNCGVGRGQCHDHAIAGLQCCKDCTHPSYSAALPNPWTVPELEEMWAGREMPDYVMRKIEQLRRNPDHRAHYSDSGQEK